MQHYNAPVDELLFSLFDVNDFESHLLQQGLTRDVTSAIAEEAGKFAEKELFSINASGDAQGVRFDGHKVFAPDGFKEAYSKYVAGGWPSLAHPEEYGGQALPRSLAVALGEFWNAANQSFCEYSWLGDGACETLLLHGTETEKTLFLPRLVSGEWTGTMCLTEPHAGSDLGLLKTKAEPLGRDLYRITGTKMFITSGEHDLADNIVHLVLARLPDAPSGSRGISLFVIPKFKVGEQGGLEELNNISCGSVEDKMGLRASATCVMNFDGAEGFMVGAPNRGLAAMFTYVNRSRLGVAVQAQGQADGAYQMSLAYAKERLQGRAPTKSTRQPGEVADPIVMHPDVQRMLTTQLVFSQGGRSMLHGCAKLLDITYAGSTEEVQNAEKKLSLLTPIVKACLSEWGSEACDLGVQVLGGHGYIHGGGVEQRLRDVRVTRIYEGTNGIQGLDLLGRKIIPDAGETLHALIDEIQDYCNGCSQDEPAGELAQMLNAKLQVWKDINEEVLNLPALGPGRVESIAFDYLMFVGYHLLAFEWLRIANAAVAKQSGVSEDWRKEKLNAAQFCFSYILPRTLSHQAIIEQNGEAILPLLEK